MAQRSPFRHLVPQGMRPRQRAELKVEFPLRRTRGLMEALREVLEHLHGGGRHVVVKCVAQAGGHELNTLAGDGGSLGVEHGENKTLRGPEALATENPGCAEV